MRTNCLLGSMLALCLIGSALGQDIWLDVDTAITVVINKKPLVATSDGYTIDEGVTYNEAGLDMQWNFITTAGVVTQTVFAPTDSGGDYDWSHVGNGIYKIEIPASGGANVNNDTEGFGWVTGTCTACLPWSSPVYGFRLAALNNNQIDAPDPNGYEQTKLMFVSAGSNVPTTAESTFEAAVGAALTTRGVTSARAGYLDNLNIGATVPTAAEVKTALEEDGSKLDHVWEMTEDDAGTRRLTTNALEAVWEDPNAPNTLNGNVYCDVNMISSDAAAAANLEAILDGSGITADVDLTARSFTITNDTGVGLAITGTTDGMTATGTAGSGIHASSSGGDGSGLELDGNGTGDGLNAASGASGSAAGIQITSASGDGITVSAAGDGVSIAGGAGPGLQVISTSDSAIEATAGTNKHGLELLGNGTGEGANITGGLTGNGLQITGGGTSGDGVYISATDGDGMDIRAGGDTDNGIKASGTGSGSGLYVYGGLTGTGLKAHGGATSGAGIYAYAVNGNAHAMQLLGNGSGTGFYAGGGDTGNGAQFIGGPTSGAGMLVKANDANDNAMELTPNGTGKAIYMADYTDFQTSVAGLAEGVWEDPNALTAELVWEDPNASSLTGVAEAVWEDPNAITGASDPVLTTTVAAGTHTTVSVTLSSGVAVSDAYRYHLLRITDATDSHSELRLITSWSAGRVAQVDRPFGFTPVSGDVAKIEGYVYPGQSKWGL